jgi:putative transposase
MNNSIQIEDDERNELLKIFRSHSDPQVRFRTHIVLLLALGHSYAVIQDMLFCSSATIARWSQRYQKEGFQGLEGRTPGRPSRLLGWSPLLAHWTLEKTPQAFGFLRSRWTCVLLTIVLWEKQRVRISEESARRMLHREGLAWRRPRPVIRKEDPQYEEKIEKVLQLLSALPVDETAVFQDEAKASTLPDIGSMWMKKGEQAELPTPGNQQKSVIAGSLNWRTGKVIATEGATMNGKLFVEHLEELRQRYRRYRKIHVICDNARFHTSAEVLAYLKQYDDRVQLHWLPKYSPETNPIERVWWHLRRELLRCHRCFDKDELRKMIFDWLEERSPFEIETSIYEQAKAA